MRVIESENLPIIALESANAIEFGMSVGVFPEILVLYDILGIQLFFYDHADNAYVEKPNSVHWSVALSECRNKGALNHIPWPGGWGIQQYLNAGYNSLGYVSRVCKNPHLADYLDNPGLLVLVIANLAVFESESLYHLNRLNLLRRLMGMQYLSKFHVKWLKKVRPGRETPGTLALRIAESLLKIPGSLDAAYQTTRHAGLDKLFSHQAQWTPKGLELAATLACSQRSVSHELAWLLHSCNGNEPTEISNAYKALLTLRDVDLLPEIVQERLAYYLANRDALSPELARRIRNAALKEELVDRAFLEISLVFLTDVDIPSPVIKGNEQVMSLDTFPKIRRQATRAKNCLWTLGIIKHVLARKIDLYSVEGQNLYTISVDRATLDIRMLESAKAASIKPTDLGIISDWFTTCTAQPR